MCYIPHNEPQTTIIKFCLLNGPNVTGYVTYFLTYGNKTQSRLLAKFYCIIGEFITKLNEHSRHEVPRKRYKSVKVTTNFCAMQSAFVGSIITVIQTHYNVHCCVYRVACL